MRKKRWMATGMALLFMMGTAMTAIAAPAGPASDPVYISRGSGHDASSGKSTNATGIKSPEKSLEEALKSGAVSKVAVRAEGGRDSSGSASGTSAGAGTGAASGTAGQVSSGGRTIDPSKPMVALTFDDGPNPAVGNRIMDAAEQVGGRVTFYLVGERVATYAGEVRRMMQDGHEIGNHSMNHKYLNKASAAEVRSQIDGCNSTIAQITGSAPATVRLPGGSGSKNSTVLANISQPIILWSIDTLDWKTRNANSTVSAVLDHVRDGDIVLMHELYSQSGDAAVRIIPELASRGYQLVTVSEMAKYKGKNLQGGTVYYSFR